MNKTHQKRKITDSNSILNSYEVQSLEKGGSIPSEERILLAFQVLDELIPKLGVYSRIFQRLRKDLFDAIFTDQCTGNTLNNVAGQADYVHWVSYFTLAQRGFQQGQNQLDQLQSELKDIKDRLSQTENRYSESLQRISHFEDEINQLNETIVMLEGCIVDKDAEVDRIEDILKENKEKSLMTESSLIQEIKNLKDKLQRTQEQTEMFKQYQRGYEALNDSFAETFFDGSKLQKNKTTLFKTNKTTLTSNIQSTRKLENQLFQILNLVIEEFDNFLEEKTSELDHEDTDIQSFLPKAKEQLEELQVQDICAQLQDKHERFKKYVQEISKELELLHRHKALLEVELETMQEGSKTQTGQSGQQTVSFGKDGGSLQVQQADSIFLASLKKVEDSDGLKYDSFIPQEHVFSKYAAVLYTSSNCGKSFQQLPGTAHCPSCTEMTFICPHKFGGAEMIFKLPQNCSHLKIVRPKVKINCLLSCNDLNSFPSAAIGGFTSLADEKKASTCQAEGEFQTASSWDNVRILDNEELLDQTEQAWQQQQHNVLIPDIITTNKERPSLLSKSDMEACIEKMWEDYQTRTSLDKRISRTLTKERTVSLMKQFCAYIVSKDETCNDSATQSVLDELYEFMEKRYHFDSVAFYSAHDFLSAVIQHSHSNRNVELFAYTLGGSLHGSCLRYVLLITDLICAIDWMYATDFRAFAAVLYPFLTEEELEDMKLGYAAFSNNRVSPQLIHYYIIQLIVTKREPRLAELASRLTLVGSQHQRDCSMEEFLVYVEENVPMASKNLCKRLFAGAKRNAGSEMIPQWSACQILAFLILQQSFPAMEKQLSPTIQQYRHGADNMGKQAETVCDNILFSLSDVKHLSKNIQRMLSYNETEPTGKEQLEHADLPM